MKLLNKILYKLLIRLVEHKDSTINEGEMNAWLINSYGRPGFKDYLTFRYATLTKFLTSGYRGNEVYEGVISKLTELRELERRAKAAFDLKQKEIQKEKDDIKN